MQKQRILVLSSNYYPEPTGIGKFNGEMIEWLSRNGYDCGIITTFPYYPYWKTQFPYINKIFRYKTELKKSPDLGDIQIYRCPHYVPAIPLGRKRVLSDLTFFISAFFRLIFIILFNRKYDYVISVAPPFQLGLLGLMYKRLRGAKLIYHIQDLQIDAAYELGMIKGKKVLKMMLAFERFIIKKSAYVSTISEAMIKRIKLKYGREVILFPNWVDTNAFHPLPYQEDIRKEFNFQKTDKIILYSGAIGEKQGLKTLLYSAKDLICHEEIKIVICGSGPYKEKLIELANQLELRNVIFMPLQPKDKFNRFLNMADLHLVLQKSNVNDLLMPSKLTNILAVSGLALVTSEPKTSLFSLIKKHNIGILIEPENQYSLTEAILNAVKGTYKDLKTNARKFAEEHLMIDNILSKYFSQVILFKKRLMLYTEEQIISALKQAELGMGVYDVCKILGITQSAFNNLKENNKDINYNIQAKSGQTTVKYFANPNISKEKIDTTSDIQLGT
jgi:colanic acid biosynthesis glycosyl transferase WcaI